VKPKSYTADAVGVAERIPKDLLWAIALRRRLEPGLRIREWYRVLRGLTAIPFKIPAHPGQEARTSPPGRQSVAWKLHDGDHGELCGLLGEE